MAVRSNRWMLAMGVPIVAAQARAEDSIGYSHETYSEDHGRMAVQTESVRAAVTFNPWLDFTITLQSTYPSANIFSIGRTFTY